MISFQAPRRVRIADFRSMTFSLPSDTRSGFSVRLLAQSNLVGLAAIVGLLWVVFTSLAPGFVSSFNLFAISRSLAIDIVIGFSTMVVLATGGMNLAIGSIGVCSVMLCGYLMQVLGFPTPLALAAGLLLGRCSAGQTDLPLSARA